MDASATEEMLSELVRVTSETFDSRTPNEVLALFSRVSGLNQWIKGHHPLVQRNLLRKAELRSAIEKLTSYERDLLQLHIRQGGSLHPRT